MHLHIAGNEISVAMSVYIMFIVTLFGLVMGSFLNCFAYRYAGGESVLKGRSKCGLCSHVLGASDLVPLLSWIFLKGRCRYCGGRISPKYLVSEVICALLYISVILRFDLTFEALKYMILMSLLFAAALTDMYCQMIPDRLVVAGIVSAFVFALFDESILSALLSTLVGGLSIALPLLMVVLLFDKLMKRETMGGGDIKLMFMIGLFFDWKLNILIIIVACFVGLAFGLVAAGKQDSEDGGLSFAPALSIAAWLTMLFGQRLMDWYLGVFL